MRAYLEAVQQQAPKRGRRRTVEAIDRRLAAIEAELPGVQPVARLKLIQERRDLKAERATLETPADVSSLEDAFVEIAASYSERQGISYRSWREVGVPVAVLSRAGISRSR